MSSTTVIQESKVFWDRSSNTLYVYDPETKGWTSLTGLLSGGMVTTEQLNNALLLKLDKAGGAITGNLTISGRLGVGGATPDATNPVAMQIPSMLLTNPSGTLNVTVSKHAAADDARFTFQTNYSTRALFGLLGDDNFTIKVSPDGSTFYTGINIDRSTGHVAIGTTADANNALSVSGSNALFTSPTGSFGFVFSKHATANDASLTFQDNFSTRALVGLLGNNDLTFKVTSDGSTWKTGFVVTGSTGAVDHTQGAKFEALTNFDNYIGANAWTKVQFNVTNHNDQSGFVAASNRFVAPVAGYYTIGFRLRFKANSTVPASLQGKFYKNGSALAYAAAESWGTVVTLKTSVSYQTTMKLAANDYIEVFAYMETNDGYVDQIESVFQGARIA
jgi:hypothetical protein